MDNNSNTSGLTPLGEVEELSADNNEPSTENNNYNMTDTESNPEQQPFEYPADFLMERVSSLEDRLAVEQDNNSFMYENLQQRNLEYDKAIRQMQALQVENERLRQQQQQQQHQQQQQPQHQTTAASMSHNPSMPPPQSSPSHHHQQSHQTQGSPPAAPPTSTPSAIEQIMMQMLQQQQQMFQQQQQQQQLFQQQQQQQQQQNTVILQQFTNSISSLKDATAKSAAAIDNQTAENEKARLKKGPSTTKFPKYNGDKATFIDWYEDVLCILSLQDWKDLYDSTTNDIIPATTSSTELLSEQLYAHLRTVLTGEASSIMKANEQKYKGQGIEFLLSMKKIFYPKWAESQHREKMSEWNNIFRHNDSIDIFGSKFKRMLRDLHYNGISISPQTAKTNFLHGLGGEFMSIRTMATLPPEFQSNDIDVLIESAREHLQRVQGNRDLQKKQKAAYQAANPSPSPAPAPRQSQSPAPAPSPRPAPRTAPAPSPTPALPSYPQNTESQREIMREIGFRCHTPERIAYWQSLAPSPDHCYFHHTLHGSPSCTRLQRAQQRANAASPTTSQFIPNPRFQPGVQVPPSALPQRSSSTSSLSPASAPAPAPAPASRPSPSARQSVAPAPPSHVPVPSPSPSSQVSDITGPTAQAPPPVMRNVSEVDSPANVNTINYDVDYYPVSITPSPPTNLISPPHTDHLTRFIVDSGATQHMCNLLSLFTSITTYENPTSFVKLGDGKHKCSIKGRGTIQFVVHGFTIKLHNVLLVPDLDVCLFSIKHHMKYSGCYEHSQNNITTIAFPSFTFDAETNHEIEFFAHPAPDNKPDFDNSTAPLVPPKFIIPYQHKPTPSLNIQISSIYKTKPLQYMPKRSTPDSIGYDLFSPQNNSVPPNSRKAIGLGFSIAIPIGLYGRIAPRSGLSLKHNIDIGGGVIDPDYRGEVKVIIINNSQKKFAINAGDKIAQLLFEHAATPAFHVLKELPDTLRSKGGFGSTDKARNSVTIEGGPPSFVPTTSPSPSPPHIIPDDASDTTPIHSNTSTTSTSPSPSSSISSSNQHLSHVPPPIQPIDKPKPTDPATVNITIDEFRKGIGFRNVEPLLPNLKLCFKDNFHLSSLDPEPVLDPGDTATIDKTKQNKAPVPLPHKFGDVMHCDIGYGCSHGIGNVRYCLFIIDRATRKKYIYPIRSLETDVLASYKKLVRDMGFPPKQIITDFDYKLMGDEIEQYFSELGTTISAAPPRHQNQNGLVERNWRSVVRMARSWLASSLLPSSFWFYAIRRAVEVSNYLPVKLRGVITTPHELVHHEKPDVRSLIPMFSVAYIDHPTPDTEKFQNQSLRVILIGKSYKSKSLIFYHPPSKEIITSSQYRLDPTLAAGPLFNLHYDGGLFFNLYHNDADKHRPPIFQLDQTVYFKPQSTSSHHLHAKILAVPLDTSNTYTIQRLDNLNIIQMPASRLFGSNPDIPPSNPTILQSKGLPSWIKHNAPATLFLTTMNKPKRGTLKQHQDHEWYFHIGRHNKTEPIHLQNFHRDALSLIQQHELIRGHPPFHNIYNQRRSNIFKESVARHISAANLKNLDAPTLLQMNKLEDLDDRASWNKAYDEEYDGLQDLPCWVNITEEQYQQMKPSVGKLLPTMAVSTIKYDENGNPKRCKFRIVALGNLDPYDWDRNDVYAPVLSLLEIRFLTSLAVKHKRSLKNGDIKQAFVQATLPDSEPYVLRPPPGCPRTPPNTYWLLKRTLYGLKRSPRHWFLKATKILKQIGLEPTPNNPCLFAGKPDGVHTLYLGLYVDDICYFSVSDECEKVFEKKLSEFTTVDFMGEVTHFLGLKFEWTHHEDGNITAHLSQRAFAEQLIASSKLSDANTVDSPYRSGHPVDSVPTQKLTPEERTKLSSEMRSLVGSILWLSQGTRPDLATITSMLAQYQANPSYGHIRAAKHVIKYIKSTISRGITFSSKTNSELQAFMNFPLPSNTLLPFTDANWGGQDQGHNRSSITELERFKTRSMSGYIIFFNGPLHWVSKRQKVTARSSAEAEIYATDECVKELLRLRHMINDLGVAHIYMPGNPINIYNDNNACVCWSKSSTTKGLRHITIRENAIRESVDNKFIRVLHIEGKTNLADLFTKEMKHITHFKSLCDLVATEPHSIIVKFNSLPSEGGC